MCCSHETHPFAKQCGLEEFSHNAVAEMAANVSTNERLLLVSCITKGEQKHVTLLQGFFGEDGCRPSRE